jgi:hypothetical protein
LLPVPEERLKSWVLSNHLVIKQQLPYPDQERKMLFIESAPGLTSLFLANRLLQQKEIVESATPNWWQKTSAK